MICKIIEDMYWASSSFKVYRLKYRSGDGRATGVIMIENVPVIAAMVAIVGLFVA